MKHKLIPAAFLSISLIFSGMSVFGQHTGGHRGNGGNRTHQTSQGNKNPDKHQGSRPGGGNQNRPNGGNGNQFRPGGNNDRPGGQSLPRPGQGSSARPGNGNSPGPRPHNNYRPTPPPPAPAPHPGFTGYRPRPSVGINISFNGISLFYSDGLYYNLSSPGQYVVSLPPIGMVVGSLYNPVYQWVNNGYYYVSQGVVYEPVNTMYGQNFRVIGYIY